MNLLNLKWPTLLALMLLLLLPIPIQAQAQSQLEVASLQDAKPSHPVVQVAPIGAPPASACLELLDRIIFIYEPVRFDFDSFHLTPRAQNALIRKADYLKTHQMESGITVEGYCDQVGSDDYNFLLGALRAYMAKDFLADAMGENPAAIRIVSFGKQKPLVDQPDEQSQAQNRRVEIKIPKAAQP